MAIAVLTKDVFVAPLMGEDLEQFLKAADLTHLRQFVRDLTEEVNYLQQYFVPRRNIIPNAGFDPDAMDLANDAVRSITAVA